MWMPNVLPTDELRNKMASIVQRIYGTNQTDLHVFGMPVISNARFDFDFFVVLNFDIFPIVSG